MSLEPIIKIKNLSVKRANQLVLEDVTADINMDEVVAIIGPNGAGKSTLLKAMLGLLPYTGEISVLGKKPSDVLHEIGYVPQRFAFEKNFPLTVGEFLHLSSNDQKAIDLALDETEMKSFYNQSIGTLSGGQLQRVLIARAIMNNPKLLFFDEPTSGIDLEGEKDFYEIIKHQNKEHGATVIMISHEVNIVYAHATQVICLNKSLTCMGTPKETLTKEVLEQLYGSDTAVREHTH